MIITPNLHHCPCQDRALALDGKAVVNREQERTLLLGWDEYKTQATMVTMMGI